MQPCQRLGFLCVARNNIATGSQRRIARLRNVAEAGVLDHCFLAIPQGLLIDGGQLKVVFHRLDLDKVANVSVTQAVMMHDNNQ